MKASGVDHEQAAAEQQQPGDDAAGLKPARHECGAGRSSAVPQQAQLQQRDDEQHEEQDDGLRRRIAHLEG